MNEKELELENLRSRAVEDGLAFGVTRLREEYRMKPSGDAKPFAYVKSKYNRFKNPVYLVSDCIPLRQVKKSTISEKQKTARRIASLKLKLQSKLNTESMQLKTWLDQNRQQIVVLDTETSGLSDSDQIIELGIVDIAGKILFENRFKPSVRISLEAEYIHGISTQMLEAEPQWPEKIDDIKNILNDKIIVVFNVGFDMRMLYQTCKAFELNTKWLDDLNTFCAMSASVRAFGATNRHGTISLSDAAFQAGENWIGNAHTAITDCQMTRKILLSIANASNSLLEELHSVETFKDSLS